MKIYFISIVILLLLGSVSAQTSGPNGEAYFDALFDSYYEHEHYEELSSISFHDLHENGLRGDSVYWVFDLVLRSNLKIKEYTFALREYNSHVKGKLESINSKVLFFNLATLEPLILKKFDDPKLDKQALDAYLNLIELMPEAQTGQLAAAHINSANLYWDLGDFESYLIHVHLSMKWAKEGNDPDRIGRAYRKLAMYHEKIDIDWDLAIQYRKQAESYNKDSNFIETVVNNNIRKAEQFRDADLNYIEAIQLLEEAKIKAASINIKEVYDQAHVALMRTQIEYKQYQEHKKTSRRSHLILIAILLILMGFFGYRYFFPDINRIHKNLCS